MDLLYDLYLKYTDHLLGYHEEFIAIYNHFLKVDGRVSKTKRTIENNTAVCIDHDKSRLRWAEGNDSRYLIVWLGWALPALAPLELEEVKALFELRRDFIDLSDEVHMRYCLSLNKHFKEDKNLHLFLKLL